MTGPQTIVLATPVFGASIGLELRLGRPRGRSGCRPDDALSSIGCGAVSQVAGVLAAGLTLGIATAAHDLFHAAVSPREDASAGAFPSVP